HVIFGENLFNTELLHTVAFGGEVMLTDPSAQISYQNGIFDITFDNHSSLNIVQGTVEMNTLNGATSPGIIRTLHFLDGSSLRIAKLGDATTSGLLKFAPNFADFTVDFDSRTGVIFPSGNIQFNSFNGSGGIAVNTTLQIQQKEIKLN